VGVESKAPRRAEDLCALDNADVVREDDNSRTYAADRGAVASGGIVEAVAGKSIQSQKGTEGSLTRPEGKAVVNSCGTRVAAHGTLCRALFPAEEDNDALESPKGYIVSGCWELKRKFRIKCQIKLD